MDLFHRSIKHPSLLGFAVFFGLGFLVFGRVFLAANREQPIRFNHAIHVSNGMNCEDCHTGARTAEKATIPGIDTCMGCHAEALTKNPEEQKIQVLAQAGKAIAWVQITQVPRHVYFSHKRHAALGSLDCSECHGPMDKRVSPPTHSFRAMDMKGCIDCHKQRKVRYDCNDCHR